MSMPKPSHVESFQNARCIYISYWLAIHTVLHTSHTAHTTHYVCMFTHAKQTAHTYLPRHDCEQTDTSDGMSNACSASCLVSSSSFLSFSLLFHSLNGGCGEMDDGSRRPTQRSNNDQSTRTHAPLHNTENAHKEVRVM
jgi:hypothetical protein